jgi:hypothetical protein
LVEDFCHLSRRKSPNPRRRRPGALFRLPPTWVQVGSVGPISAVSRAVLPGATFVAPRTPNAERLAAGEAATANALACVVTRSSHGRISSRLCVRTARRFDLLVCCCWLGRVMNPHVNCLPRIGFRLKRPHQARRLSQRAKWSRLLTGHAPLPLPSFIFSGRNPANSACAICLISCSASGFSPA